MALELRHGQGADTEVGNVGKLARVAEPAADGLPLAMRWRGLFDPAMAERLVRAHLRRVTGGDELDVAPDGEDVADPV